jgi:hypothetical protein
MNLRERIAAAVSPDQTPTCPLNLRDQAAAIVRLSRELFELGIDARGEIERLERRIEWLECELAGERKAAEMRRERVGT